MIKLSHKTYKSKSVSPVTAKGEPTHLEKGGMLILVRVTQSPHVTTAPGCSDDNESRASGLTAGTETTKREEPWWE